MLLFKMGKKTKPAIGKNSQFGEDYSDLFDVILSGFFITVTVTFVS